jgi:hypothetical protein
VRFVLDGELVPVWNIAPSTSGGASTTAFGARCGTAAPRGQRLSACIGLAPAIAGTAPITVARRA